MTFEEWWKTKSGWGPETNGSEYALAEAAYSAGLERAAEIVDEHNSWYVEGNAVERELRFTARSIRAELEKTNDV